VWTSVLKHDTVQSGKWVRTVWKNVLTPKCANCLKMFAASPAETYNRPRHRLHKPQRYSVRTFD